MALLFHHLSLSSFLTLFFPKLLSECLALWFFQQCAAQALASCWFISSPSCFLRPRASASSKVVVRGLPSVSGNSIVSTPMMNARIPTMSCTAVMMKGKRMNLLLTFLINYGLLRSKQITKHNNNTPNSWTSQEKMHLPEADRPRRQPDTHRRGPPRCQHGTSYCHYPLPETWWEIMHKVSSITAESTDSLTSRYRHKAFHN